MNSRHGAEIALGVAGVWLIASRLPEIVMTVVISLTQRNDGQRWMAMAAVGLTILCAAGLVLLRHRIAAWLVPTPQPVSGGTATGTQAIAFSVLAVFLVARGVTHFLGLAMSRSDAGVWQIERLATTVVEIAIGVALFVGSRRLAATWESLRTVGLRGGEPRDAGA